MKITVNVTQKHIDEGQRMRCTSCPIALALNEQHPRPGVWSVNGLVAAVRGNSWESYALPLLALDFICSFDVGAPVKPLTLELETANDR